MGLLPRFQHRRFAGLRIRNSRVFPHGAIGIALKGFDARTAPRFLGCAVGVVETLGRGSTQPLAARPQNARSDSVTSAGKWSGYRGRVRVSRLNVPELRALVRVFESIHLAAEVFFQRVLENAGAEEWRHVSIGVARVEDLVPNFERSLTLNYVIDANYIAAVCDRFDDRDMSRCHRRSDSRDRKQRRRWEGTGRVRPTG